MTTGTGAAPGAATHALMADLAQMDSQDGLAMAALAAVDEASAESASARDAYAKALYAEREALVRTVAARWDFEDARDHWETGPDRRLPAAALQDEALADAATTAALAERELAEARQVLDAARARRATARGAYQAAVAALGSLSADPNGAKAATLCNPPRGPAAAATNAGR